MQQTIDLNLFKENPQLFFSYLPKSAEKEIVEFLHFIIYKYNIDIDESLKDQKKDNSLLEYFSTMRTGLPQDYKFNREEANER
jgi:hypothetical protein